MKKIVLILILVLTVGCSVNKTSDIKFDNSKTKYKVQEGFLLPILSDDKLVFNENNQFKEFSKTYKKHSSKSVLHDTCVVVHSKRKTKSHKKRYCFFLGHLSTVIENDSIKAEWKDKNNKDVCFQYQTQIGYHKNGKIEYYVNWLVGNKLYSEFQIGTKYYFDENGKLLDSLDLGKHYKNHFKDIYKKLYELEEPYNYDNIESISRYFDNKNSMWVINYYNQRNDVIIDDKTLDVYYANDIEQTILSIYKNFDFEYRKNEEYEYPMIRF